MQLRWGAATDVGRLRHDNQDSYLANDRVLAVADGMGGHRGGEIASKIAVETIESAYSQATIDALHDAIETANREVLLRAADNPELRGMGTTLVAIAPVDAEDEPSVDGTARQAVGWVNIGDSRLYLFRDGELEQLSEDHSLVEEMVRDGRIAPEAARTHPQRNIVTRALGIDPRPRIDMGTVIPYVGDRFLLCSDGLSNEVDEDRIAATLRRLADPDDAARELVRLALEGGGRDNVTVVIGDVIDDGNAAAAASAAIGTTTAEGHADTATKRDARDKGAATAKQSRRERRAARSRPRVLTARLVLFVLVLLALVGGAAFAVIHQARSGYTVKVVDGQVLIYQGTGDKVLWLKPKVAENKGQREIARKDVEAVSNGVHFGSLAAANHYVDVTLTTDYASEGEAARSTTTTTTTTVPTTTTTAPIVVPPN